MNSNLNSVVTFFGDYSIALLQESPTKVRKNKATLPGREISQKLRRALKNKGFLVTSIQFHSPFFTFTVTIQENEFSIDTMLLGFEDMLFPQWSVSCIQRFSLLEKILGGKEKAGYAELLDIIHRILQRDKKISNIAWYRDVNSELNSNSYAITPLPTPKKRKKRVSSGSSNHELF